MQSSCFHRRHLGLLFVCCLLLLICKVPLTSGQVVQCAKKISSCQCQTTSGKYIDLSPLSKRDDYRFKRVPGSKPSSSWLYSYNPCIGFKCEGADNVASCQNDKGQLEFALGTQDTAEFGFILGKGLHLRYTSSHAGTTRVSMVTLDCSQSGTDEFVPTDDGIVNVDTVTYSSTLTSRYVCEVDSLPSGGGGGGMSVGDVLLIVLFVGAFAYLAGGFAVNVLVLKKGLGLDAAPNGAFWLALTGYIRDGAVFCFDKVRQLFTQRRGGYEST